MSSVAYLDMHATNWSIVSEIEPINEASWVRLNEQWLRPQI